MPESGKRTAGGLVPRLARDAAGVEALRDAWIRLPVSYVDAELDYFLAFVRHRVDVLRPHVVVLEDEDGPRGLVVAYIETAPFVSRFGYRTVYKPTLRNLRVAHGGVVGADDPTVARSLAEMLERALEEGEADAFVVPAVRLNSPLDDALRTSAGPLRRQRFAGAATHRRMAVPDTYEELLAKRDSKGRYNLKRAASQLQKAYGDELAIDVLSEADDFDRLFAELEEVAAKTYQRGLGAGFMDTPERRAQVRVALEHKWLRAWLMTIAERPVAFWLGNQRGDSFYVSSTAYDPEYARQSVGVVLQMRMFEDLCADPTIAFVDFGWGDAEYKARFGTESWQEHDVVVMAPSLRGFSVHAIRTVIHGADHASRRLLQATGMTTKLKRVWRGRLRRH